MDAQTHNFINLACDFRELWKTDKNPLEWTQAERDELIKAARETEKFIDYGYFMVDENLCWSIHGAKNLYKF